MEDHVHICLEVTRDMQKHLGNIVQYLKKTTTTYYLHLLNLQDKTLHLTLQTEKREQTKQQQRLTKAIAEASQNPKSPISDFSKPALTLTDEIRILMALNTPKAQAQPGNAKSGSYQAQALSGNAESSSYQEQALSGNAESGSYQEQALSGNAESGSYQEQALSGHVGGGSAAPKVAYVAPLWSKGYHDRIVSKHGQIARQKIYINRNPARLWAKRNANRAFTSVTDCRYPIPLPLAQKLKDTATYWDQRRSVLHSQFSSRRDGKTYADTYLELVQKFLRKDCSTDKVQPFLKFRCCGNKALIYSPRPFIRIRLSRSITKEEFETEANRILDACEHEGAIAISPFRSWSEKAVLNLLRMNGYDHIIITDTSIWEGWKPQDTSTSSHSQPTPAWYQAYYIDTTHTPSDFEEVYNGHCAFISLWTDRPKGEKGGKADCEIMNEAAHIIEQSA